MRARLALLLLASTTLVHCAPQRARAIRDDKLVSVGYPGVAFRPTGKVAVGSTFSWGFDVKAKMDEASQNLGVLTSSAPKDEEAAADERELTYSYSSINPFVQVFPWDDSAFFVGIGASLVRSSYYVEEETIGSTALAPTTTGIGYKTKSSYVGVPIGWAWIWENGLSLTADLGPRFRVGRDAELTEDGSASDVDIAKRDATVEKLDAVERPVHFGGLFLGYSF